MSDTKDCVAQAKDAMSKLEDIVTDSGSDSTAATELLKQIVSINLALEKLSRAVGEFDDDELDREEEDEEEEDEEETESE